MKIVMACEILPPEIGGPATYVQRLIPFLKEAGHEVTVVSYGVEGVVYDMNGMRALVVPKHLNIVMRYLRYCRALHRRATVGSVIYAQGLVRAGLPALVAARLRGVRLVVRVPGDYAWEQAHKTKSIGATVVDWRPRLWQPLSVARQLTQRLVARRATRVVVQAECTRRMVLSWGVHPNQITVVRNAAPEFAGPTRVNARTAEEGSFVPLIVAGGRIVSSKGLDTVLRAIEMIRAQRTQFHLMVVGDGPQRVLLEELSKRFDLTSCVTFCGRVSRLEVWRLLRTATVVVNASHFEADSHSLLEAMAARVVIVASDNAGNRELIDDGVSGCLFPIADYWMLARVLMKLLSSESLRQRLIDGASLRLSHHTVAAANYRSLLALQ